MKNVYQFFKQLLEVVVSFSKSLQEELNRPTNPETREYLNFHMKKDMFYNPFNNY